MGWSQFGVLILLLLAVPAVSCGSRSPAEADLPAAADGRADAGLAPAETSDPGFFLDLHDAAAEPDGDLVRYSDGETVDATGMKADSEVHYCQGKVHFANSFDGEAPVDGWEIESIVPSYPDKPDLVPPVWTVSSSRFHSPPASLYFGIPGAGHYNNGHRVGARAISPSLELNAVLGHSAGFWLYVDVEEETFSDFLTMRVMTSQAAVPVWTRQESVVMREWFFVQVDLSPFAGQPVSLEFSFDSWDEFENSGEGVYIDDIEVTGECEAAFPCGSDSACNNSYPCVSGTCVDGACAWQYEQQCCLTPADCEDWDGCTIEKCSENQCLWQDDLDTGCCNLNQECQDELPDCTADVCKKSNCLFLPSGH